MAKLGLKYPVYAIATETTSAISYAGGTVLAKAISAKLAISSNDEKCYADDGVAEIDKSFSSGSVTIGVDDLYDAAKVALLGYIEGSIIDVSAGTKELKAAGSATLPYVGFGFYSKVRRGGVDKWRAIWLKKVQFGEPSDEFETKGEKTTFKTPELEGTIMVAVDGYWKEEGTFDTEAEAVTYLNGKAGITTSVSNNITTLTATGGTLAPVFAAATRNYACACTANLVLTATFAAGTAKVYVDGVYNQALSTTAASTAIALVVGDSKLVQIIVQESGKTPVTYQIMATR